MSQPDELKVITITGTAIVYAFQMGFLLFVYLHRDFRPFRARQIENLIIYSVSAMAANIGSLVRIGALTDGIWTDCVLWLVWVQSMGSSFAAASFIYRYNLLYCHGIARNPTKFQLWGPVVIPCILMAHVCLIPYFVPYAVTSTPMEDPRYPGSLVCFFPDNAYPPLIFIVMAIQYLILLYFNFYTSRLPKVFVQYKEMRNALFIGLVLMFIPPLIAFAGKDSYYESWLINLVVPTSLLLAILLPPTYWYFKDPKCYQNSMNFTKKKDTSSRPKMLLDAVKHGMHSRTNQDTDMNDTSEDGTCIIGS